MNVHIKRDPQPNAGQEKAITTLDRNLLVSAGAGSGKTWVLTERYLEILSKGYRPSQIIAITFTEKAAGEMKGRIRQAIQKMKLQGETEGERTYWESCERELKQSIITTIHGFCARLLRADPVAVGLDPDFQVLDGTESQLLQNDIFREQVQSFLEEESEASLLLYEEFSMIDSIVQAVQTLYGNLRTYHLTPEQMWTETAKKMEEQKEQFEEILDQLDRLIEQLKAEFESIKALREASGKKPLKYFADVEDWLARFERIRPPLGECQAEVDEQLEEQIDDFLSKQWTKSGTDTFKEMTDHLRKEVLPALVQCLIQPRFGKVVQALLDVLSRCQNAYEKEKQGQQAVDFNDLEGLAAQLLTDHPYVVQHWQQSVQFLMVDEYQDTNKVQKQIMDQFSGHGDQIRLFVVGDGKQSIYRFRGADVQVFYEMEEQIRSQGGEKVSLAVNFRTQEGVIRYVNSLFEQLMSQEDGEEPLPLYYTAYEDLEAFRRVQRSTPEVELLCAGEEEGEEEEGAEVKENRHWSEKEADLLARRLKQMVEEEETLIWKKDEGVSPSDDGQDDDQTNEQTEKEAEERPHPVRYGDVAVLLAARTHMHTYEYTFQQYGIPYVVVGGRQFYQKQEILDLINVLKLIQFPDDEVALLAFLRSPFVQLKDTTLFWLTRSSSLRQAFWELHEKPEPVEEEEWHHVKQARQWLDKWLQLRQWQGVYDLLQTVVADTGYVYMLMGGAQGEQAVANVHKFFDLARQIVDEQHVHLYDFVQHLKRVQEEEVAEEEASMIDDRGDAVVIMSVHASKGLEFPVVCIPEIRKGVMRKGGSTPRVLYQPGKGVGVRLKDVEKGRPGNGLYEQLQTEEQDRELQEAKRLLYVAITRARDHVLFVGSKPKSDKNTWLRWLMDHAGVETYDEWWEKEHIHTDQWHMTVIQEDALPRYAQEDEGSTHKSAPKVIDLSTEGDHSEVLPMPLMETEKAPYPWKERESGDHIPPLSATSLSVLDRCPRLFYLRYIEGLFGLEYVFGETDEANGRHAAHTSHAAHVEDDLDVAADHVREDGNFPFDPPLDEGFDGEFDHGEKSPLSPTERGTLIHDLIEKYPHIEPSSSENAHEDEKTKTRINWKPFMIEQLRQQGVDEQRINEMDEQEWQELLRYMHHYERFLHQRAQARAGQEAATVHVEHECHMLWQGHPLFGLIDRLEIDDEGEVSIFDFKTNRLPEETGDPQVIEKAVTATGVSYHLQGYVYTFLVEQALGKRVKEMTFVFLQNGQTYSLPLTDTDRNHAQRDLNEKIRFLHQHRHLEEYPACQDADCVCSKVPTNE